MFHRHSTLFGFAATAVTVLAVGQLSRWNPLWMMVTGLAGVCVLPRFFYGFAEARALDEEGHAEDDPAEPRKLTFFESKWALLAAFLVVVCVGLLLEMGADALRLKLGPHGWFVISSSRDYRGRSQTDFAENGPFAGKSQCIDWIRKSDYHFGTYCRDILYSDAKAIWRGPEPMPTGPIQ